MRLHLLRSGWVLWLWSLAGLALIACGPPDVGRTTGGPLLEEDPPPPDAPPRPAGRPYAQHPIAPFAEAMTDFALGAVRGGPLPSCPIPMSGDVGPVAYREGVEPPGQDMHVLGFAFEVELVLKRGAPLADAEGAARWGSVHAIFGVTRHGLRLVELRPRRVRPARTEGQPPSAMSGVHPIAADLLDDVQRQDLSEWSLGEPDRRLLGNDAIWNRVNGDRPRDVHIRELSTLLASVERERMGMILGDLAVLVALPDGRLLSLALTLVPDGPSYVLRADPIVEVGQVWPILASTELR